MAPVLVVTWIRLVYELLLSLPADGCFKRKKNSENEAYSSLSSLNAANPNMCGFSFTPLSQKEKLLLRMLTDLIAVLLPRMTDAEKNQPCKPSPPLSAEAFPLRQVVDQQLRLLFPVNGNKPL